MTDPGGFGRRLARRRKELGLSLEGLSERTGTAETYLTHLETSAVAMPDARTVLKLAAGLDTTAAQLLGTSPDRPSGAGGAGASPHTSQLSESECWALLTPGGVGRLVFDSERGPTALPINFALFDHTVAFRTEAGSPFERLDGGEPIGLEVDRLDEDFREGWSVLVTGRVRRALDGADLDTVATLHLSPWPGGTGDVYLLLEATEITGRRIEVAR